ncbi:UPF0029 Superfamily protein [Blumeria hordei DH14]|uniref:UPF0029 Superfamily protein n=1 Tax=Blumeria graminis f. sp. hordei (strain DH14) TaxID=546991 RepID=N1JMW4_BLUG1|nr:UPF0029 Superfamily protein [Blumeria hordei DH14]
MSSQANIQDLLRLLTTGRKRISLIDAMARVKMLQTVNLGSIFDIASSDTKTLSTALGDEKVARSLLAACKLFIKEREMVAGEQHKRPATQSFSSAKRPRYLYELPTQPQTPVAMESSLQLPTECQDEVAIQRAELLTSHASLMLAFAVQLLKYTFPLQPLSSRLSLGLAAVSLYFDAMPRGKGKNVMIGESGYPQVRILGQDVSVLKRGSCKGPEKHHDEQDIIDADTATPSCESSVGQAATALRTQWTVSAPVVSKQSRFIARSIAITDASQATSNLRDLLANNEALLNASHNMMAWRVLGESGVILEGFQDDGETGGGRHILGLLRAQKLSGILLIVSRWYGGVFLGPDRWRIISQVSHDALSQRLRVKGRLGSEALWGLDLGSSGTGENSPLVISKPEEARVCLLKSFASPPLASHASRKGAQALRGSGAEENLELLLGALDLLFSSWAEHVSPDELDRKALAWYSRMRPKVSAGSRGWSDEGLVQLSGILALRKT